jgi:hypothetical protein
MPPDTPNYRLAKALRIQPKTARLTGLLADRAPGVGYTRDALRRILDARDKNLSTQLSHARSVLPAGSIVSVTTYELTDIGRAAVASALAAYNAKEAAR